MTSVKHLGILFALAAAALAPAAAHAQTTYTNSTITLTAAGMRDRLYDACAASALMQNPVQAAVLHLMEETTRLNPGVLSASSALVVMQNVVGAMTNTLGSKPQMTMMDMCSLALPYLQTEFSKVLPANNVGAIQAGLTMNVLAEQQGLYSAVYSNITTALPIGSVFSDVENTASGILTLERQAASEVATLALPEQIRKASDGAFRQAAAQLVFQITAITPQDSVNTIIQTLPAFQNNPFLQNLAKIAENAGQVVTDVNSCLGEATNTINSLSLSTSNNITLLSQISVYQQDILGSQTNVTAMGSSRILAQQIQTNWLASVANAQPTVTFLSTVISDAGDPQLGKQVATIGGAAIKIAGAVNQLAGNADLVNGVLSFSSSLAVGNFLGAAVGIFSSLFGSSGPSPEQVILDQIKELQKNVAQLSSQVNAGFKQLNSRFDQVDTVLTNILHQLDYNLNLINTDFNYVANNLDQIRSGLFDLQGQIARLESQTYSYLTALGNQDLQLALNGGLAHEETYGVPLDYTGFQVYENTFYTWANNFSSDGLREPTPSSCPSCYTVPGLYDQFTTHSAPELNLGYVNNFVFNTLGQPMPFNGASPLANPRVWSITANAYSQLCIENPAWFRQLSVSRLNDIIQVGNNLNTFLNHLVALNTNAPNIDLWIAACNGYRNAVQTFTNAILNDLALFAITNNFPAGFNPFTNLFLSLVTPQAGTLQDGYYPNASVVSVTAMACSATADGLPVYFMDKNTLRKLDASGVIATLAGSATAGFADGFPGLLNGPRGLAVASNGNVYISDTGNHAIRVFGTNGLLTTLAGVFPGTNNTTPVAGAADGVGSNARFNFPQGLLLDRQGNLLVADTGNHAIRKLTPGGYVTTFAGTLGRLGTRNGVIASLGSGPAQFDSPWGIAVGLDGSVYVTDSYNQIVRRLVPIGSNIWEVVTLVGQPYEPGFADGAGGSAAFDFPAGIASDSAGNLYVADSYNNAIRKITPAGAVTTVAGGVDGYDDGTNAAAQFSSPQGVAADGAGNLYVADTDNHTIRRITPVGTNWVVSTFAGRPRVSGSANGFGTNASFYMPTAVALDAATNVYVADAGNSLIRKITPAGQVSYFGTNAQFFYPNGLAVDGASNVYVASLDCTIRLISPSGMASTFAGSPGAVGTKDGYRLDARFYGPQGIAVDGTGNVYVADYFNNAIRRISPEGNVSTIAGVAGGPGGYSDGANVPAAQFWTPEGLAMDTNGLIYVTDPISRTVRTIDTNGIVGTYPAYPTSLAFLLPQVLTTPSPAAPNRAFAALTVALSASDYGFSLAAKADGTVAAWGWNREGECNVPTALNNVVAVAAGTSYSLALKADGTVAAWGDNFFGECNVPAGLGNVVAVAVGDDPSDPGDGHSLALKADGTVAAWGVNYSGECNVPAGLGNVVAVAAGAKHSLALKADGTVAAWGSNSYGDCNVPAGLGNVVAIVAPGYRSLALKADGTVAAWGDNSYGQCNVPAGLGNVVAVAVSSYHSLALKADGTVAAWGYNKAGECNVPAGLGNIVAVAAGGGHSLALKADGTVAAWGDNSYGECNVPAGLGNVVTIAASYGFSLATRSDGTVAAWGYNYDGECNVPAPTLPQQLNDTFVADAAVQQFTAGLITPDGGALVVDQFGLRLLDNSRRIQKQAASYLMNNMENSAGGLHTAAQNLTAWHLLLQTLATYGLNGALKSNDALNALLFGSNPLIDSAVATTYINNLVNTTDWEPTHGDASAGFQTIALGQINQLQSVLLAAVTQEATKPNPASLPLVTDTLNRLSLLLATHSQPIPPPALGLTSGTSQGLQVTLNGLPYVHYGLQTSSDLRTWATNSTVFRQSGSTSVSTAGTAAKFFRGRQNP